MGNIWGVFLVILCPFVCLGVVVLLGTGGIAALVGGALNARTPAQPSAPGAPPALARPGERTSVATILLLVFGAGALGLAVLIAVPTGMLINEYMKSVSRDKKVKAAQAGIQQDLEMLGAAEASYRRANGGFYDTPACLARPGDCIPGYGEGAFVDPALASLAPRRGYVLTFVPGPAAPRDPSGRVSPSSLIGYAIKAKSTEFPAEAYGACIDARGRLACLTLDPVVTRGVCGCGGQGDGVYVSPLVIEFSSQPGADPCPQRVGQLYVSNRSNRQVTTHLRLAAPAPLTFGPDVTLAPLEGKSVDVFYTCAAKDDFSAEVIAFRPEDITPQDSFESKSTIYVTIAR
jgi:hypothetical protein